MARAERIEVEVVYALPDEQALVRLQLAANATVFEAIEQSGLLARYTRIGAAPLSVGIFGQRVSPATRLKQGDRVEIYRPLTVDPKDARRRRAGSRVGKAQRR
ncbi:MAG: RnfH family protein [Betaproteobacteria bacterium]|nr:RnfH family protein [Betaproteobacteria bacterium]